MTIHSKSIQIPDNATGKVTPSTYTNGSQFKLRGFRFQTYTSGGNTGNFAVVNCRLAGDSQFVGRLLQVGHIHSEFEIAEIDMDNSTARGMEWLGE